MLLNKQEDCFQDYNKEVVYLAISSLLNNLNSNRIVCLGQFNHSQINSNNKIIYLDKLILNYLASHSQLNNNNKLL